MKWGGETVKLNSEAVRAGMTGEMPTPEKRLVWRWWRCWPLVAMGTVAVVMVLATMLQAWLLSMTPREVWMDLYYILGLEM